MILICGIIRLQLYFYQRHKNVIQGKNMNLQRTEPLEELTAHPREFIQRLKESGDSVTLTVDGKAELIVHSAEQDYDYVLDEETEALLLDQINNFDESKCVAAIPLLEQMLEEQKARLQK
jgi:hypothetical protein